MKLYKPKNHNPMKKRARLFKDAKINGYEIRFNPLWNTLQISHKEIGACIAEFKPKYRTLALQYCEN
jgi:hypothetical protein